MKLILYGTKDDRAEVARAVSTLPELCYRRIRIADYPDYDSFLAGLDADPPDCVIIAMNGAEGMEGVIAARNTCRNAPILWFSDDGGFGAQSYRLGCTYFHQKPMSPEILSEAIGKCV